MSFKVVVSPRADRDVDRLEDWLADKNPAAAAKIWPAMKAAFLSLADMPHRTRGLGEDTRELLVNFGRYGYVIRYQVTGQSVVVTRVFHGLEMR